MTTLAVSPTPGTSPRHRRSAATAEASPVIPASVERSTPTTTRSHRSGLGAGRKTPLTNCDVMLGEIRIWRTAPIAAGVASTRNSDHSRPKVSKVRPITEPMPSRGPTAYAAGTIHPGYP